MKRAKAASTPFFRRRTLSISRSFTHAVFAAVAACSLMLAGAPSQAAVVGSFDPSFGPSISNLGFRGTFTLDVSNGCYTNGPGYEYTGYGYGYNFAGCEITVDAMEINFYDTTNGQTLQSIDLVAAGYVSVVDYVYGAYFDPQTDQFTSFDSNDTGQFPVSVTDGNTTYTGNMILYFVSGHEDVPGASTVDSAHTVDCRFVADGTSCTPDTGIPSNPATVTVTTIPEPGTMPLALLGVLALAAVRRRARGGATPGLSLAH